MTAFTEEYYRTGNYAGYLLRGESVARMAGEIDRFIDTIGLSDVKSKALDFGCGPGFLVHGLTAAGWSVTGYDVSEWAVDEARKNRTAWALFTTDVDRIIRQDFRITFALDVLEHMHDASVESKLADLRTDHWFVRIPVCATNGGRYILDISEQDPTHKIRWTKARWRQLFERAGFIEVCRPSLATIWDSPGVMVSLFRRV